MVDMTIPAEGSFLVLENLHRDKTGSRTIHVMQPSPEKQTFKLGRGHESDVRISDISVSRLHAIIKCVPEGYFIEDNNSKFGTVVLVRSPAELDSATKFVLQVGRTIVSFAVKPQQLDKYVRMFRE
jgi:hypothetical protein